MPFQAEKFKQHAELNDQEITYSGVGAHHQNGVAEQKISTVTHWARAMLLHSYQNWPELARLDLWPFALEHAVYIWNHLPQQDIRLSPIEVFLVLWYMS